MGSRSKTSQLKSASRRYMDCGCSARNERSYRFRRADKATHTMACPKAGAGRFSQATAPTPTPRRSKAATSPFQGCAVALIRCRSPLRGSLRLSICLQRSSTRFAPVPKKLSKNSASLKRHAIIQHASAYIHRIKTSAQTRPLSAIAGGHGRPFRGRRCHF